MELLRNKLADIADLLTEYAQKKGLTQRELALRLGKDVGYLNKVLKGEANLNLRTIVEFEEKLGIMLLKPAERPWLSSSNSNMNDKVSKTSQKDRSSLFWRAIAS